MSKDCNNATVRKLTLLLLIVTAFALPVRAGDFDNPKAKKPPRAKPHRRTGGEGLPPLPLPATPLRRSEKKRQPAPPALVGMIHFSGDRFKMVDGRRVPVRKFPTTQIDIERLVNYARSRLKINYRYMPMTLDKFSWDPTELPLLYVTGWTPMPELDGKMIAKLRRYLYDGGTLVVHAQCGRSEFSLSAMKEIARVFPKRKIVRISQDSPLFSAYFPIDKVRVRVDKKDFQERKPELYGVYVGCRPAIIFSPIDLNCGWDVVKNPIMGGTLYHQDDGLAMGVNIITTTLANFQYARAFATEKLYHEQNTPARDRLIIAQIRHGGDWDPTPHALPNLMKYVQHNTTLNVQFKRDVVELSSAEVGRHPVLYMTGLQDFKLTNAEVVRLRNYLAGGGLLVADASAGRKAFDAAFRREMKRVLPKHELKLLESDSPAYQMPYTIKTVKYTDLVRTTNSKLNTPKLEGISIDGQLGVIYSSMGLSNGWEQLGYAYNRGYSDRDTLRLGVNIFAYAMTH